MIDSDLTLDEIPTATRHRLRRRIAFILSLLLAILLLAFIPPLVNVNRFGRRIALNLGAALGRPVHFGRVTLNLLPLPGFTLENFVVEEDPAFGFEPILRADTVHASIRISSLWSARTEFSKIALTDPSVNLVRTPAGRWNLESILLQASRIEAAPTPQRHAGPASRFPYIEATGARLNFKLGDEKLPFSLNDSNFALWLPQPRQWHFRLEAHPLRTDTAPADTGTLRLEGTLGGALAHAVADIPIDVHGDWQDAQLGGITRLALGRDAGLRGGLSLDLSILGTLGQAALATDVKLARLRRADFIPPNLLFLEIGCQAVAQDTFHALSGIECHWPPSTSSNPVIFIAAASVPDTRHPATGSVNLTLPALPAAIFLDWLRAATPHPPAGLQPTGSLAGTLTRRAAQPGSPATWFGDVEFSGASLQSSGLGLAPIPLGDMLLHSTSAALSPVPLSFDLLPITLPLGGRQPAVLEAHFDATGYTLHLTGFAIPNRLLALGDAIPQLGDGLRQFLDPTTAAPSTGAATLADSRTPTSAKPAPPLRSSDPSAGNAIHIDLTATRTWGSPQTWHRTATPSSNTRARSSRKIPR